MASGDVCGLLCECLIAKSTTACMSRIGINGGICTTGAKRRPSTLPISSLPEREWGMTSPEYIRIR